MGAPDGEPGTVSTSGGEGGAMLEVALGGLVVAVVLLSFSETAAEWWVVGRWRRRGGPSRAEDWQVRHAAVVAVGMVVIIIGLAWALVGSPLLGVVWAVMNLGQHRSLVRLHRRWHAGEFAVHEAAR